MADRFGDAAWIHGGSPTDGFLKFGLHTKEPFSGFYEGLAGSTLIEWVYMLSMAAIGVALMLGIATRLAAGAGIVWMLLFYTASALSPENNPFLDDHIIYAIVLAGIAVVGGARYLGLGRQWERLSFSREGPDRSADPRPRRGPPRRHVTTRSLRGPRQSFAVSLRTGRDGYYARTADEPPQPARFAVAGARTRVEHGA